MSSQAHSEAVEDKCKMMAVKNIKEHDDFGPRLGTWCYLYINHMYAFHRKHTVQFKMAHSLQSSTRTVQPQGFIK